MRSVSIPGGAFLGIENGIAGGVDDRAQQLVSAPEVVVELAAAGRREAADVIV